MAQQSSIDYNKGKSKNVNLTRTRRCFEPSRNNFTYNQSSEVPSNPANAMEFLSRPWSPSSRDLLQMFSSSNLLLKDTGGRDDYEEQSEEILDSSSNRAFTNKQYIKVDLHHMKGWLKGKSPFWFFRSNQEKKEKLRLQTAKLHAVLSLTQLASGIVGFASNSSSEIRDTHQINYDREGKWNHNMGNVVASAAALMTTVCAEAAESLGARRAQVASAVNSGLAIQTPMDMIAVTATAATCLRGASILKSRAIEDSFPRIPEMLTAGARIWIIMPSDLVDVYFVHQISEPIVVNDDVAATPSFLLVSHGDVADPFETDRADVSSSHPWDINKDEYINENQSSRTDKGKAKVSCEDLGEGQVNDFSAYHLQTFDSELNFDITDSDGDSLYDVDENIEELSDFDEELFQARKSNIEKQAKEKTDRVNLVRYHLDQEALQGYSIQKGVNLKLKPNEKERVRAKCEHKDCPWVILESVDNTKNFSVKTYLPVHKCSKRTGNKMCNPLWISEHDKDRIMSDPSIKLHQIQALLRKDYGLYVSKTTRRKENIRIMNGHFGDFVEEFARLYDYAEQLRTTNPGTTISIRISKSVILGKEVFMGIYICLGASNSGWKEGCRRIIHLHGAFLKGVCKDILLSCIFNDENNQMYPIAWVVVDKETKDTWSWFLRCISHDLELEENGGEGLTVMSDMQKGLHLALTNLLSNAEHRCDVSPMAMEVLAENGEYATKCEVRFNGDMGFEISDPPYTYVVNVKRKQCSCSSWQLKGIPYVHAIAAMH
ncbi:putative (+)-neomenthol dehydrogenase-like [Capsicum annuum]|nr:putative (+)-neomenthol dehydrogenase-like [Capsicum annuum]KAF3639865.1 putative (+)-neomenthol dehydrogenase-like [Capsicum annuum]